MSFALENRFQKISHNSPYWVILVFLLLLLPAILPVFRPYVSGTADGLGHKFRLVSFYKSLSEGNLRPRWNSEAALGYGAPIFLYNYPLPYYIGSLFVKLGYSINRSGQLLSAFSFFFSGIFMFILARELTGSFLGGLVAGITYLYAPYHLQMSYLYGAWGEELAFVFPPLILYLIIFLVKNFEESNLFLRKIKLGNFIPTKSTNLVIFVALIITWVLFVLSHNLSAIMLSPMLLLLGLIAADFRKNKFLVLINAFLLIVLISSFFWLPGLLLPNEIKYPELLLSEGVMRGSFFKSLSFQLITAVRVIQEGVTHYLDFTVGLPIMLGGIISLFILIAPYLGWTRQEKKLLTGNAKYWIAALLILLVVCLFLVNHASNWFWQLPLVLWMPPSYILYPFRFLIAASFIGALLTGIVARQNLFLALGLITLAIFQGRPYTNPYTDIFPFPDSYFWQRQTVFAAPFTRKNLIVIEHLPKDANLDFLKKEEEKYYQEYDKNKENKQREEAFISAGEGSVYNIKSLSELLKMKLEAKNDVTLTINRFYFPNWQASIDDKTVLINRDSDGRMTLSVNRGIHEITLRFGLSPIEKVANTITYFGFVLLAIEIISVKLKKGRLSFLWNT